jgi:hypothetical protein
MCRYAMVAYKPHYACFNCRKTFKRRLMWDINRDDKSDPISAKCPQCGALMADMGLDFASPKKDDIKQWEHIKRLYSVGITFHSCGCSGPGYIPNSKESLISYFQGLLEKYQCQLNFWRQRTEPENEREIQRENSKYWHFIEKVPSSPKSRKGAIPNEDAKQFWFGRIQEIEQKLEILSQGS